MLCERCGLHRTRRNIVVGRGDPGARVWFIGEAPGFKEDEKGLPFVGPAGQELNKALEFLGLGQGKYYITNLVRCRPVENGRNRPPTDEEKAVCGEYLLEDLGKYNPGLVVALGRHATFSLLGDIGPMTKNSGTLWDFGKHGKVFVMLHPAAILHNPDLRKRWADSLEKLKKVLPCI